MRARLLRKAIASAKMLDARDAERYRCTICKDVRFLLVEADDATQRREPCPGCNARPVPQGLPVRPLA